MKKETKKKRKRQALDNAKWIRISLCGLLLIIIIVLIVTFFISQDKMKANEPKPEPTVQPTDPAEVKTPDYYTVINYLNLNTLPEEYYGYFFKNDELSVDDMDNKIKVYMAIRKIVADNPNAYLNTDKKLEINASDVEKALTTLFGKKVKVEHTSLSGNACSYTDFKYDKENNLYTQMPSDCPDAARNTIYTELVNTNEDEDKIVISEKVAIINFDYNLEEKKTYYYVYRDLEATDLIATVENYGIDSCRDSVPTYQFTFLKDKESGSYYFDKVELVK